MLPWFLNLQMKHNIDWSCSKRYIKDQMIDTFAEISCSNRNFFLKISYSERQLVEELISQVKINYLIYYYN